MCDRYRSTARPETPTPPAYREPPPSGWTTAQPNDAALRGEWWRLFNEPALDALEDQVNISNQNVIAAEAQYRAARAAVRVTAADRYPTVTATPSATHAGGGAAQHHGDLYECRSTSPTRPMSGGAFVGASPQMLQSRRRVRRISKARDFCINPSSHPTTSRCRVSMPTACCSSRRSVRTEQYLQLTQDRFQGGVVSMADVALAQTQLEGARTQLTDIGIARAQFDHAIAVLTGHAPSELSIPPATTEPLPPTVPVGLPSSLLERRPDIAAAERRVAAANQQIGVAKAAFYPVISLGGSAGSQAVALADLFASPTRVWSVGVQVAATLLDGGRRRAQVKVTEAAYDTTVANYQRDSAHWISAG